MMVSCRQKLLLQKQCARCECPLQKLQSQFAEPESLRVDVAQLCERLGQNSQNPLRISTLIRFYRQARPGDNRRDANAAASLGIKNVGGVHCRLSKGGRWLRGCANDHW